jgi:radical SAM superfamily enzyme YgiQ (UPF0313 family)
MRSAASVAREVEWHRSRGWKAIRFNDDNFLLNRERVLRICELLHSLDVRFRIFARADCLDPEICHSLAHAGCRHISVGVESLSPLMLARMGKATSVERIRNGLRAAHRAGISTRGFFICGFPGETDETVQESVDGLIELALDEAVVYPCIPYPGTDLFARPERYGITWIDDDFSRFIQVGVKRCAGFVMATETFGPDEMQAWREIYMQAFTQVGMAWSAEKQVVI